MMAVSYTHCCQKDEINWNMKLETLSRVLGTTQVTAHSAVSIAMGWTVLGLDPDGGKIFRTYPDWPWGPSSLPDNGYQVSFPGVKRPERGSDHPPPPSTFIACCGVNLIFLPLPLTTHHCLTSPDILLLKSLHLHYSAQWSSQLELNELRPHTSAIYHFWREVFPTKILYALHLSYE